MDSYSYLLFIAIILLSTKVTGLMTEKIHMPQVVGALLAGIILGSAAAGAAAEAAASGPVRVELMFVALCVAAVIIALLFARISKRNPSLRLDAPAGKA